MTESDYLHECSRAELLGLPKPSKDDFFLKQSKTEGEEKIDDKELTAEQEGDTGVSKEEFHRVRGGLDELNCILSSTQRKINRLKAVCGSFSNLLKLQIGAKKEENEEPVMNSKSAEENLEGVERSGTPVLEFSQVRVNEKGNSQLNKLDSLISKAERAEISLSSQNKQMKKFIN